MHRHARGLALSGETALDWLEGRGLRFLGRANELRIFADAYSAPEISFARVWKTAGTYSSRTHGAADELQVTVVTDGSMRLSSPAGPLTLDRGRAFLSGDDGLTLTLDAPAATVEVVLSDAFTERFAVGSPPGLPVDPVGRYAPMLASLVNSVLTGLEDPREEWPLLVASIENLAATLLLDAAATRLRGTPAEKRLVRRALETIRRRSSDASFTVSALAR
ncbi:hypothetical protein, partial [Rathayibacter tanaceti]